MFVTKELLEAAADIGDSVGLSNLCKLNRQSRYECKSWIRGIIKDLNSQKRYELLFDSAKNGI